MKRKDVFRLLVVAALCSGGHHIYAQGEASMSAERGSIRLNAYLEARRAFDGGDLERGEDRLKSITFPPDSVEAYIEAASMLVHAAFEFRREGTPEMSAAIAQRALRQLDKAQKKLHGGDHATLVTVQTLAGTIQEHLLGNFEAAKRHYAAAAELAPGEGLAGDNLKRVNAPRK